jgi:3-phenylpropionate/cinnamic acid dioxygenase small subunit
MLKKLVNADQQFEIEQFYYYEARLLDEHNYAEWLDLYSEDTRYWMPIRETRTSDDLDQEFGKPGDVAYYDDEKPMLSPPASVASRPATPGRKTRLRARAT